MTHYIFFTVADSAVFIIVLLQFLLPGKKKKKKKKKNYSENINQECRATLPQSEAIVILITQLCLDLALTCLH